MAKEMIRIRVRAQLLLQKVEVIVRHALRFVQRRCMITVSVQVAVVQLDMVKPLQAARRVHVHLADRKSVV